MCRIDQLDRATYLVVLIYIHGFNSSALSFKAGLLRKRMIERRRFRDFLCPDLPHRPRHAIALLDGLVRKHGPGNVALVGSSLGGYYATWLSEQHALPTVLLNPAVRPHDLLSRYVGTQANLYTGAQYEFTKQHLADLIALETERITPDRYLLMVQTGDEILSYAEAVQKYQGCEQLVIEGGDHGFSDFEDHIEIALAFCRKRT
jgi:predicted esterase YcpF (UPF0227 family)